MINPAFVVGTENSNSQLSRRIFSTELFTKHHTSSNTIEVGALSEEIISLVDYRRPVLQQTRMTWCCKVSLSLYAAQHLVLVQSFLSTKTPNAESRCSDLDKSNEIQRVWGMSVDYGVQMSRRMEMSPTPNPRTQIQKPTSTGVLPKQIWVYHRLPLRWINIYDTISLLEQKFSHSSIIVVRCDRPLLHPTVG